MERLTDFTLEERKETESLIEEIKNSLGAAIGLSDEVMIRDILRKAMDENRIQRDVFGLHPVVMQLHTALIAVEEIGLGRDGVLAILIYTRVIDGSMTEDDVEAKFGKGVKAIVHGLVRLHELYKKTPVIKTEDFRNLLVSFAEDMRVVLLMIADRVNIMRKIRSTDNDSARKRVAEEASYLYAPLAHKLGLYKLKSELEDLSLKYLEHDAYYHIKDKLSATKETRDLYIKNFIEPVSMALEKAGLKFHIKGRTKSIHSIWQKMKKQHCPFEGVYDLFAIRIILDSPEDKEKKECWHTYSIITDMYQPNPKRLRDWLSVPKSNGYESLHITVLGPENKWVEVQIRTERMDDIAERGLAAHWRYKGIKGEGGIDEWLSSIRGALEAGDNLQVMDQFRMGLYEEEVYVFSPRGDIMKFPIGATVLDFAYHIHTRIGNMCTGAKINGKNVQMREVLHSGDTVEIITSANQKPKQEWLQIVKTSHARSKIRGALKEAQAKEGIFAKELIERRLTNRKIKMDESVLQQTIKRLGYKIVSDFYKDIANDALDINTVIEKYQELLEPQQVSTTPEKPRSAEEYSFEGQNADASTYAEDVMVIDRNLKGVDYSLAKCCNPIYGDDVFGFVTVGGGIKIHRCDCPNASELRSRFGYRIVKARWSGKGNAQYDITLQIIGNDDIGILNNITSIISKEEKIIMRSVNIDSNDGLFRGNITIRIDDNSRLETLIKKINGVKGVRGVRRV